MPAALMHLTYNIICDTTGRRRKSYCDGLEATRRITPVSPPRNGRKLGGVSIAVRTEDRLPKKMTAPTFVNDLLIIEPELRQHKMKYS